jgi:hypothetical protein
LYISMRERKIQLLLLHTLYILLQEDEALGEINVIPR